MFSFWEKRSFLISDVLIVGSGIVGLSTACSLKEKNPSLNVTVVERNPFPSGATTKNAGFSCFGSVTEIAADLKKMSESEVAELVKDRYEGLKLMRRRLGDEALDYKEYGGYDVLLDDESLTDDEIDRVNELLMPIFGEKVYEDVSSQIEAFGFPKARVRRLIRNRFEGQIDSGKLVKSLTTYAASLGVFLVAGCEVSSFEEEERSVAVYASSAAVPEPIVFKASQVIFCTNSVTRKFFSNISLKPGRSQVLVTKPLEKVPFRGTFHMQEGFFYFRDFYDRIIFGGGRNLDFEGETTEELVVNAKIAEVLDQYLREIILPGMDFEVEHRWAGIMDFGETKLPLICRMSDRTCVAAGLNGMGVALGSLAGERVSVMLGNVF